MKKLSILLSLLLVLGLFAGCEDKSTPDEDDPTPVFWDNASVAVAFMDDLSNRDFAAAFPLLSKGSVDVIQSPEGLESRWTRIEENLGAYQIHEDPGYFEAAEGYDSYNFVTTFGNNRHMFQVVVFEEEVAGFYLLEYYEIAEEYLQHLIAEEAEEIYDLSNETLKDALDQSGGFQPVWDSILVETGAYLSTTSAPGALRQLTAEIYYFESRFENGPYIVTISISDGLANGFSVTPRDNNTVNRNAQAKTEGPLPSEDLPDGVAEQDIVVNLGQPHELYGKLTYPENVSGPIPVVVLVHGSGANDMDETIFANAPFKDIAYALPLEGVAVLRYHKVTYAYPEDFSNATITVDMETVDDAVAAKQALMDQADIEFSAYFVAGHSQGGIMAPRIATLGGYDGLISLAGSPRSLIDISWDQANYLLPISGLPEDQVETLLDQYVQLLVEAREVMELPYEELSGKTAMNFPAQFVYSMDNPSPESYIRELDIPMLFLQGSKDFQVYADKDFAEYQRITAGMDSVTLKLYDGLGHLFTPSFMDSPDTREYQTPATVSSEVTDDMAAWIKANS